MSLLYKIWLTNQNSNYNIKILNTTFLQWQRPFAGSFFSQIINYKICNNRNIETCKNVLTKENKRLAVGDFLCFTAYQFLD